VVLTEKKSARWLSVFTDFIKLLRIDSKEVAAIDDKGSALNMWGSQKRFLEAVCQGLDNGQRIFYCLKSRQVGLTTLSLVFDVFWLAMYPATIGALVTDTPKNSAANRRAIRRYVESIPKGFFGKSFSIVDDNRDFITFSNGSRLDLLVAGTRNKKTWGEGVGYVFAHLTEVASYGSKEGLDSFREALADNHPNRFVIYEGTAKGFNHWRDMWISAKRDVHTCVTVFVGWWSKDLNTIKQTDPRYATFNYDPTSEEQELIDAVEEQYNYKITTEQLAWYRWKASADDVDINTLYQNQPWTEGQAFVMTGFSFFATRMLQQDLARIQNPDDPISFKGYKYILGNDFQAGIMEPITHMSQIEEVRLRVWEDPIPTAVYVIGMDVAWGRNDWADRTCVSVWRCFADKLVQVAEYADSDVDTRQAAWVLAHLAGAYKDCRINIELTGGPGMAVMTEFDHLKDRMRSDMYREKVRKDYDWDDFLQTAQWYLYHKPDSLGAGYAKGWVSSHDSKWRMMCSYKDTHTSGMLLTRSVGLVEEMLTVVQDGSEISAPGKAKDDRVFAAGLANMGWVEWVRPSMIQQGLSYDVVLRMDSEEESNKGAAFVDQIVMRFMQRQEEYEAPPTPREQWLRDRGFM
jgi:hypothetical protein